jgi:hypothetical protein
VTYAHACEQNQSVSTLTELTWPLDSKISIMVANVAQREAQNSCSVQTETTNNKQLNKQPAKSCYKSLYSINRPGPASSKAVSKRGRNGANNPVGQFNRFGPLDDVGSDDGDDDME